MYAAARSLICPAKCQKLRSADAQAYVVPPPSRTVEEWLIEENGIILPPRGNAFPGPLRLDRTPYLRKMLEWFTDPDIERIGTCFARQVGKTTWLQIALGYIIDYDPDSTMLLYPTEKMGKDVSRDRLQPMLDATPALRKHKTSNEDDYQLLMYRLDRMTIRFAHAGSEVSGRSHPIRYLIKDETSAITAGASANADDTTTSFWNRKIIEASTPMHEGDNMWRFLGLEPEDGKKGVDLWDTDSWVPKGATKVFFFHVPCPHCGTMIQFVWRQLRWPDDIPIRDIPSKGWYECQSCSEKMYDFQKTGMVSKGEWFPHPSQKDTAHASWVGAQMNQLYGPWDSCRFGVIAQKGLRAKLSKDPEVIARFVNNALALPYSIEHESIELVEEEAIKQNVIGYSRNTIPDDCRVLTIGIDVGKATASRVHYIVQGFGAKHRNWRIAWGVVDDLFQMETYIKESVFVHPKAGKMLILAGAADSRWNKPEVIAFCKRMRGKIFPCVGEQTINPDPGRVHALPHKAYYPERDMNGKPIPNSMIGYRINTMYWKQWVYGRINCLYGSKPTFFFPVERDPVLERHLRSEEEIIKRKKGSTQVVRVWMPKKGFVANHYLDATVYGCAIANVFNILDHPENGAVYTGIKKTAQERGPSSNNGNNMNFPKMKF